MATTISKPDKSSHLRRTARSREAGYPGKSQDQKPSLNEEIRQRSIACDLDGAIEEPKTASPAAAFVSSAKAIVPVLLALIPFGVAFGAELDWGAANRNTDRK
jgi:hypothetical protein